MTCSKCQMAKLLRRQAALTHGRVTGETYTFTLSAPDQEITWSIDVARGYIRDGLVERRELDPVMLRAWLDQYVDCEIEHLDHLPAEKLDEPGILIVVANVPPDGVEEAFPILLDGTHRAYRALRDGRPFFAWVLSERQQVGCRIEHLVEGEPKLDWNFLPGAPYPVEATGLVKA